MLLGVTAFCLMLFWSGWSNFFGAFSGYNDTSIPIIESILAKSVKNQFLIVGT